MTLAQIPADGIKGLHRAKDCAYGQAWKKRGQLIGVYANLARKVDRLEHQDKSPTSPDNESRAETLIDLYVYTLKYLTFLADHDPGLAAEFSPNTPSGTLFSDDALHFEQLHKQRAALDVPAPARNVSVILEDLEGNLTGGGPIEARIQLALELANTVQCQVQALPPNQVQTLFENSPPGVMTSENVPVGFAGSLPLHPSSAMQPQDLGMRDDDFQKLFDDAVDAIRRRRLPAAILGDGATCCRLIRCLEDVGLLQYVDTVYSLDASAINTNPIQDLFRVQYETIIVAADRGKELLIEAALPYIRGAPRLIVAGYSHYEFEDPIFHAELSQLKIESLANGYANSLPHLYQCLRNAARLNRDGVVAEFGMYRGGTTMFLARIIHRLGKDWRIYGFDTFTGFPERRDARDMYSHHDLFDNDEPSVREYLRRENVEIIAGDIVETASVLAGKPIVLAFMDTDNYSPAKAALDVIRDNVVVGGAIVFDHFTGENRFRYTLGERMAAQILLDDPRFFNLHSTGVFIRQAVEP